MSDRLEKENDMTDEKTWDELSDHDAGHTPEIIREIQVPDRAPPRRMILTTSSPAGLSPTSRVPKPISLRRPI